MMSENTNQPIVAIVPVDGERGLLQQTLSEAQVDFLLQRTPKAEIKKRKGRGGMMLDYVEHGYVTERLNLIFGFNWDFEIVSRERFEDEVMVEARLTVRTPVGQTIVKTQFGGADIKRFSSGDKTGQPLSLADDYKAAGSDALKKCASLLGIGLDLYGRDRAEGAPDAPRQEQQDRPGREPTPIRPTSVRDLYKELFAIGKAIGLNGKGECFDLIKAIAMGKEIDDLNAEALQVAIEQARKVKSRDHAMQIIDERLNPSPAPVTAVAGSSPSDSEFDTMLPPHPGTAGSPDIAHDHDVPRPENRSPNGDRATDKQLKAIYAIGRTSKRLSESQVDDRCAEVFGITPSELTKAEASQFIDILKG